MATKTEHAPYGARELSAFSAQLALVLRAGMFLPDGVAAMANGAVSANVHATATPPTSGRA